MYPVNEVFETIQGEGSHCGVPSIFVRLQGCDVGCPWCDTMHTWELDPANQVVEIEVMQVDGSVGRWANLSAQNLADRLSQGNYQAKWVVITGGEPCMHDLRPLTHALEAKGFRCQIETSGTYPVLVSDDTYVTVSPKVDMKGGKAVLTQALARADEIKHPVARQAHIDQLDQLLADIDTSDKSVCLQPISQKHAATQLAIDTCIQRNWRLSVQTHKYLNID
ncbi:7-carboxy-7-deazaguanine synthase QueE [Paraferrimonas sedimenticola]|uniref:7-carboxy-7-deazaguanine synthase n=1 Tax=Paraferrimonas sedimenticola TaxID=375674 RepID=A0AA37RZ93_9GAMM|nr:7-carboxy-7-deazaguanine synthase QueE [Paraferrimonas sedimenticola]GLP97878.1 7-carboxy-7-deazaguanine synthase [Paraferrimonas sedimenticola]